MPYGVIQRLLSEEYRIFDDVVLIESPFIETTRSGHRLRRVIIALTSSKLIIATAKKYQSDNEGGRTFNSIDLSSLHPLSMVELSVFKKTRRQALKVCFNKETTSYYDLRAVDKRMMWWELWCLHVGGLRFAGRRRWPFSGAPAVPFSGAGGGSQTLYYLWDQMEGTSDTLRELSTEEAPQKVNRRRWTDKYLYLGSKREVEDNERPTPVPGLGLPGNTKLLCLRPRALGSWDQSEHWVQCDNSRFRTNCDYDVCTYTGHPTSNITYTSLIHH